MDLATLMRMVEQDWPFNENNYHGYGTLSAQQQRSFALKHILLHQMKVNGYLAGLIEPVDHDLGIMSLEAIQVTVHPCFRNTLRLAVFAGVTAEELIKTIEEASA